MRKLLVSMLVAAMALVALAGCSSGASSSAASSSASGEAPLSAASSSASAEAPSSEAESSDAPATGGWEMNAEAASSLSAEQKELFEKATEELDGVDYEPVAVIGEQVVAGMNYAYLCKATVVAPDAKPAWSVVVIYKDLDGKASFTSAKDIDLADIKTADADAGVTVAGGWSVPDPAELVDLPEAAQKALDGAFEEYAGVDLISPVALLGTQVVAGTNYEVLFVGMPVVPDAENALYAATVYQDPQGTCELTDVAQLDLVYYVTEDAA